jgi:hypothetical protein
MTSRSPGISATTERCATSNWFAAQDIRNPKAPVRNAKPPFSTRNRNAQECGIMAVMVRCIFDLELRGEFIARSV